MSNMVMIDNQLGVSMQGAGETDNERKLIFKDSFVYGEGTDIASDCPDGTTGTTGANCYCPDKYGLMSFGSNRKGKTLHITSASARPIYKIKSYSAWNTKVEITDVNFINFKSAETACKGKQSVFALNPHGSDYIPIHFFEKAKFTNVHFDALIYLYDPPNKWANVTDCGSWPCTAPHNVVMNFNDAVFEVPDATTALPSFWTTETTKYDFQAVADFPAAASSYPNCTKNGTWNAWICADAAQTAVNQVDVLQFESLDGDTEDRSVQPVIITGSETGYSNTLNSVMDHEWDGFYTGQHRLSRFPAQIQAGQSYTVTYTGTPPNNMRYWLMGDTGSLGIVVKVPYPNAGSFSIKVAG